MKSLMLSENPLIKLKPDKPASLDPVITSPNRTIPVDPITGKLGKNETPFDSMVFNSKPGPLPEMLKPPALKKFSPALGVQKRMELDLQSYLRAHLGGSDILPAEGPVLSCGFDAETFEKPNGDVCVLSFQAYVRYGDLVYTHIHYPKGMTKEDRPTVSQFLSEVVAGVMAEGIIDEPPSAITLFSHFIRADAVLWKDFFNFKHEMDAIGGTFATLFRPYGVDIDVEGSKPYRPDPIILKGPGKQRYRCLVRFVDTLLLTPGRAGLSVVGDMLEMPKLTIPEPYSIARMDEYLEGDPAGFEAYAMRDAEIACEYGLAMYGFAQDQLGLDGLPATLGACSVAYFMNSLRDFEHLKDPDLSFFSLFGFKYEFEEQWNGKTNRVQRKRKKVLTPASKFHRDFVTDCCAGGRNEAFYVGPTPVGRFVDVDLRGAYTRGLCDIHPLDYEGIYTSKNVSDYLGHVMGFAYVKFRFPDGTRFPCLPVDGGNHGRIFPLEGECYCGAPEIALAHNLGAELEMLYGIIVPWKNPEVRIFQPFVQRIRDDRAKHRARGEEFQESLIKAIGNNIFGKTYQGLQNKTAFDSSTGLSKMIGESAVSSPYFAGHTTSFVRAVCGELLSRIPDDKTFTNITTDGGICNMDIDELDISGPLCQRFQQLCNMLHEGEHMLEKKHVVRQLIGMKTRGQLTAMPWEGEKPVLAKAGYKPPCPKPEHNDHMVARYLNRQPGDTYTFESLISMREQWMTDSDLKRMRQKRRINYEFDMKRCPVDPRELPVLDTTHLAFDTKPWRNLAEFKKVRATFDGWRTQHCLKTDADWSHWQDYLAVKLAQKPKCGIKFQDGEGSDSLLKRVFLRAYGAGEFGIEKDMTHQQLADWLTAQGYPTSLDDVKSGSRNRSSLPHRIIPVTDRVVALFRVLMERYPELEVAKLVQVGQADDCLRQMGMQLH